MKRFIGVGIASVMIAAPASAELALDSSDPLKVLSRMSLEQLSNVEVTSVSKAAQSLASAPASIYVITREEIIRSGVLSIPEALRLAPNMQVTQLTASEYSNGARGFAGSPDVQNFSNKILILIDGRSAYNPLFSGISYEMQDVLMDDVDRIEVISGPGATLWGANAMNGVINIITRSAHDTKGGLVRLDGGPEEQALGARFGAGFGEDGAWRVYAKAFDRGDTEFVDGTGASDDWNKIQAGFRVDLGGEKQRFTLSGDYQDAAHSQLDADDVTFKGANLLGRWEHAGERVSTRLQAFYDRIDRETTVTGIAYEIDTWDLDLQQSANLGSRHKLIWGLGQRSNKYSTVNGNVAFVPDHRNLQLTNIFVQDNIALSDELKLSAGVKLEDNSYSEWSVLPDLRLSWSPNDRALWWLAASRAIRSPTPFDADVQEFVGGQLFVLGDPNFKTEKVTAYELGFRGQPDAAVSFSGSVFYNDYDDLRSIEVTPVGFLPLRWGNLLEGSAYGFEAWANLQLNSWWRVSPGFRTLHKRLRFSEGASGIVGVSQAGNDPSSQYSLKSSMDFGRISVDAILREVGALPAPQADSYTELVARVAWQVNDDLQVAIKGSNLLNDTHAESAVPEGREIKRSVMAELRWQY